jgi:type III secretion system low calcium response chaperone LcrH/SycD
MAETEAGVSEYAKDILDTLEMNDEQRGMSGSILKLLENGGTLKDMNNLTDRDMEVIYSLGLNFYKSAKYDKARSMFQFLCFYDHTNPKWWNGLGATQQMLKDYERAINAFAYATLLDVENPQPQLQAGYCLMALQKYEEAVSALEGAIITCGNDASFATFKTQAETLLATAEAKAEEEE